MGRVKNDYEKQLERKLKRHSAFDNSRNLDQIVLERDNLRELCHTFRWLLCELAKCVTVCEEDLNKTIFDELQKHGIKPQDTDIHNKSTQSHDTSNDTEELNKLNEQQQRMLRLAPDVSGILSLIEDPSLVNFVSENIEDNFNLTNCLLKLKSEAEYLLELSEKLCRRNNGNVLKVGGIDASGSAGGGCVGGGSGGDSCEEEDGLKSNNSIKNQKNNTNFERALSSSVVQLEDVMLSNCAKEEYTISQLRSPSHQLFKTNKMLTLFTQLQDRIRLHLSEAITPGDHPIDNSNILLQLIEDFCREGDKFMEDERKTKDDLQEQIYAADNQKKATLKFLEEQAAEREQERDDFTKEIEKLKVQLREREKERNNFERALKETENSEQVIKEMKQIIGEQDQRRQQYEIDLKAATDKIDVLREIIIELETQIERKSLNEDVIVNKIKDLENYIGTQYNELESLKTEITPAYEQKINKLEEVIRNTRPNSEQSLLLEQITDQLKVVADTLDRKTKVLETLHSVCSASCSSPSEDVSCKGQEIKKEQYVDDESPRPLPSLPVDEVHIIMEKLAKHTRVEEAAIKRIHDLDMQINGMRTSYAELQHERDILQEKMSEQILRISTLQARLDEQRHRAEELHKQGTSDLNLKIYDLQTTINNLNETLTARDKQIATLKQHLEQSKIIIDRQEAELALGIDDDRSKLEKLETEIKLKTNENQKLKEKIRTEMINKFALPDLMETMLADKNEELDQLRDKLDKTEKQLQYYLDLYKNLNQGDCNDDRVPCENIDGGDVGGGGDGKDSARTLSDIVSISDYDEPDVQRKVAQHQQIDGQIPILGGVNMEQSNFFMKNENTVKPGPKIPYNYFQDLSMYPKETDTISPSPQPRQIHFSQIDSTNSVDRSKFSTLNPLQNQTPDSTNIASAASSVMKKDISTKPLENIPEEQHQNRSISSPSQKNAENEKLKTQMNQLQSELEHKSKLVEDVIAEKQRLQLEIDDLKIKLRKLNKVEDEQVKQELELCKLEQKIGENNNEIVHLSKLLTDKTERHEQLLKDFELVKRDKESIDVKNEILLQQIQSLNKTLTHKDELLEKHEKNLINFTYTENKYLEQLNELQVEINGLKYELEKSKNDVTPAATTTAVSISATQISPTRQQQLELTTTEFQRLKLDLDKSHKELNQYMVTCEQLKLELQKKEKHIYDLKDLLSDSKSPRSVEEMRIKIRVEQEKSALLESEIERLKVALHRTEMSSSPIPFSVDEIARNVERELNYSAQLDSNILKAIESDDALHSSQENLKQIRQQQTKEDNRELKKKLHEEKENSERLRVELEMEKKKFGVFQEEDSKIIETMRLRLEAALEHESNLQNLLDNERKKTDRLTTQILLTQRTKSIENSLSSSLVSLGGGGGGSVKSPCDSPNRRQQKQNEFESELIIRLQSELKLLTAQNERERERVKDIERNLEREKNRFEKELKDRQDYDDRLTREMDRVLKDKDTVEREAEHIRERLSHAHREIESLEVRLSNLQEIESRRVTLRGQERYDLTQHVVDVQELKTKLKLLELERDKLQEHIVILRQDLERSAVRETKLTDALAKEHSGDGAMSERFLLKLKEMYSMLSENTKDNRQMSETIHNLTEERRALQKRIRELENVGNRLDNNHERTSRTDLEDRANHLFGKYLRVESFRKSLVHQKRYLSIILRTYQENETKALRLLNGNKLPNKKASSFRSAVFVVIAIQRMKFIVRRWQNGKVICSRALFTQQLQPQRSSSLSTINNWLPQQHNIDTKNNNNYIITEATTSTVATVSSTTTNRSSIQPASPPSRDKPLFTSHLPHRNTLSLQQLRPLQAPSLISECSERLENLQIRSKWSS